MGVTDIDCMSNLRMDKNTFGKLCSLLRQVGVLHDGKYVKVEEQVAIFLAIIAHHQKNRIVRFRFLRSGQTVSQYVHKVLHSILKLHDILLVNPDPVQEDCTDPRWKWFKVIHNMIMWFVFTFLICFEMISILYIVVANVFIGLPWCIGRNLY